MRWMSLFVCGMCLVTAACASAAPRNAPKRAETTFPHQVIVRGAAAGGYAAFPDLCRTREGDLVCAFYSGYQHISTPKVGPWEWGGRIMTVRSRDNGRTWSEPRVAMDTPHDDRDPGLSCLKDGTLVLTWFTTWNPADRPKDEPSPHGMFFSTSVDGGHVWAPAQRIRFQAPDWYVCSAPVRELKNGAWILGLYHEEPGGAVGWGATIKSYDNGKSWTDLATIGKDAKLQLDAETDVVQLKNGSLLAALRSSKVNLHFARSTDRGHHWSAPVDSGFKGHSPVFLRTRKGILLLAHRLPGTSLHWSADWGKTWKGPVQIDTVIGAYPGLAELPDGDVYCVYYEEGPGSGIRGMRLKVDKRGVHPSRSRR